MKLSLVWTIFTFLVLAGCATSSKILFVVSFPGKSHWLMFEHVIYELLNRGHEVTAITNYELVTDSKNYRSLIIAPRFDWDAQLNMTQFFEAGGKSESTLFKIQSLWHYGIETTKVTLDSPVVKDFIEKDRTPFDLIIVEQFQQEALNMFAIKYRCPLITIGTLDIADYMDRARGALTPWSFVPHFLAYKSDRMTFYQRLENTAVSLFDAIGRKFYYLPKQTQLARDAFASLANEKGGRLPSTEELEKAIAVHLVNGHPALSYPRPRMPGLVDIAGIQIRKPKPLPSEIQTFLDGAEHGAIYISFGSFLRSSMMPPLKYEAMLDVFRRINQRVLWKWESDEIPNIPPNVMVKKWLPQSDVLAHKNVKLFICHGGLFGLQEAVYNAVPMIVFPFYGDQHLNGFKMEQRGIALMKSMSEMTSESLFTAINTITNNQTFYNNIKALSEIFKTNQNEPLDTAIWWIEYVIKFKGAPHLQSAAKHISWFRYLQLDILVVILGIIYFIYDYVKNLFNKVDAKKSGKGKSEDKNETKNDEATKDSSTKKKHKKVKKEN